MNQNMNYFAEKGNLPDWFEYPTGFRNLVEQGSVNFKPWCLVDADFAMKTYPALRERYGRELFPIALRQGTDDVACLEKGRGEVIAIINGYTSPGWENEDEFESFWQWFRAAIDEMIEFYS
ncbi:MAG: hypothetical protein WCP06_13790 [Verrucomicrobiota bacterium]